MNNEKIKQLESLIGELQAEFGGPINITYPVLQDGFGLAVYEGKSGNLKDSVKSYDLRSAIEQLKQKIKK